jgi:hypothetical protein
VAQYFNRAYLLVENNGVGLSVVDYLWYTLEVSNMVVLDKKNLGLRMSRPLRNKGIAKAKDYIETGVMEINDMDTLAELSKFIQHARTKKFQAEPGCNDDLVMGLVMFSYFTNEQQFSSYLDGGSVGGIDAIRKRMRDKVSEDNPYLIDQAAITGDKNAVNIVTADDFRKNRTQENYFHF